jgi:hypothetical protein
LKINFNQGRNAFDQLAISRADDTVVTVTTPSLLDDLPETART